jgi:hypothetical protein
MHKNCAAKPNEQIRPKDSPGYHPSISRNLPSTVTRLVSSTESLKMMMSLLSRRRQVFHRHPSDDICCPTTVVALHCSSLLMDEKKRGTDVGIVVVGRG